MTCSNRRVAVGAGLAALLAGGPATMMIGQIESADKMTSQEIAAKSREAYASLFSYSDSGTVSCEMGGQNNTLTLKTRLQRPNQYRFDWAVSKRLEGMPGQNGVVWSDPSGDYFLGTDTGPEKNAAPRKMQNQPAKPEAIAAMRPQMRAIMKQVRTTIKSGFESGVVFTQIHNNIVVNEILPLAAFNR